MTVVGPVTACGQSRGLWSLLSGVCWPADLDWVGIPQALSLRVHAKKHRRNLVPPVLFVTHNSESRLLLDQYFLLSEGRASNWHSLLGERQSLIADIYDHRVT